MVEEVQKDFDVIESRDDEKYDENEAWNTECLAFRYYNLLANYKAFKNVSINCMILG